MSLSIAIVGFPNVGKSTLFNALLKRQVALAANYPFATIEPNVGIVEVPDERLPKLAEIAKTTVIKPATVEFVDVAGLVKGASQGEGLGNKFLAHIREASAICHVIRAFSDENVLREGATNPAEDIATIRTELRLADLATLEKQSAPKGAVDKDAKERWQWVSTFKEWIEAEKAFDQQLDSLTPEQRLIAERIATELCLLTAKPEIAVLNVGEDQIAEFQDKVSTIAPQLGLKPEQMVVISAKVESELSNLSTEDQALYLQELGLELSGLERLAAVAYKTLGLQSFLTAGEQEVRAWTVRQGAMAPEAAGVIHSDFTKKFIKANVTSYEDYVTHQGWRGVKEAGKLRLEGRDYVMQEGDVVEFMIGA